ncbi:MAG TPA: AraC family transcriptional regulator ligand-binding domain-containing protein [Methyloceanibacter sp.]|nr:AraC family transcriptional regulator ligand-binding domain-containing protein [Methyloceanibacter sp.]
MPDETFAHNPRTLLHIAPYLRSRSVNPIEIFQRAGVSPSALLDANGWVPRDLCFSLGNEMYAATGERFPGASVGRLFKLSDLGSWGTAVSGAATLCQACEVAASGVGLVHQGTDLRLVESNGRAILSFAFAGRSNFDPRQHILGALAVLRSVALRAGVPEAVGAQFTQPYERAGEHLEETFGSSLAFGRDCDGIVIDRAILDFALLNANGASNDSDPVETATTLGALLRRMLPYGNVTVESMATHLGMSTRTLQRRLRDFGFAFEEIVDDVRRVEATRRVVTGDGSSMEIAFMLGYSDQAHFIRAFRRWTGMPPRDYARGA